MKTLNRVHILKPDPQVGITPAHVLGLANEYKRNGQLAPVVIGHPESDAEPAWGWVEKLYSEGEGDDINLYSDLDVTDEFYQLLRERRFSERSVAFFDREPYQLRHLAFLGAVPPRIKGLAPVNLSDKEPFMSQNAPAPVVTELPLATPPSTSPAPATNVPTPTAAPAVTTPPPEAPRPVVDSAVAPAIAHYALSDVTPGIKTSSLTTESITDTKISGTFELSDGKSYSYTVEKVGEKWNASTTLRNPEMVTLSDQVKSLQSQLAHQRATATADAFYKEHRLSDGILPRTDCVKLLALSEGTELGVTILKLLSNLPPLVSAAPVTAAPEAPVAGFGSFELSETAEYKRVVAKCLEMGLDPKDPKDFTKALNALSM
jgi:3-oxoacyl-[acyl-carrier protein] reductase